jgi:hypothetical protein
MQGRINGFHTKFGRFKKREFQDCQPLVSSMGERDPEFYIDGVRSGDRRILAKTITLIESAHPAHRQWGAPWWTGCCRKREKPCASASPVFPVSARAPSSKASA